MKLDISPKVHRALSLQSSFEGRSMREIADEGISAVIDSRIWELMGECEKPKMEKSTFSHPPVVAKAQYEKSTIDKNEIVEKAQCNKTDVVEKAKKYILAELEAGREPLASEVAAHVGMDSRALGPLMTAAGLGAKSTTRKGKGVRLYTLDMIDAFRKP